MGTSSHNLDTFNIAGKLKLWVINVIIWSTLDTNNGNIVIVLPLSSIICDILDKCSVYIVQFTWSMAYCKFF